MEEALSYGAGLSPERLPEADLPLVVGGAFMRYSPLSGAGLPPERLPEAGLQLVGGAFTQCSCHRFALPLARGGGSERARDIAGSWKLG